MISQWTKQSSTRRLATRIATRRGSSLSFTGSRRGGLLGVVRLQRQYQQYLFYTTERVVELRSGQKTPIPTLYNAKNETENCGVGLIASLKSVPSRKIVEQADEMLVRMAHRGGCGCDPASGDGSGTHYRGPVDVFECLINHNLFCFLFSSSI